MAANTNSSDEVKTEQGSSNAKSAFEERQAQFRKDFEASGSLVSKYCSDGNADISCQVIGGSMQASLGCDLKPGVNQDEVQNAINKYCQNNLRKNSAGNNAAPGQTTADAQAAEAKADTTAKKQVGLGEEGDAKSWFICASSVDVCTEYNYPCDGCSETLAQAKQKFLANRPYFKFENGCANIALATGACVNCIQAENASNAGAICRDTKDDIFEKSGGNSDGRTCKRKYMAKGGDGTGKESVRCVYQLGEINKELSGIANRNIYANGDTYANECIGIEADIKASYLAVGLPYTGNMYDPNQSTTGSDQTDFTRNVRSCIRQRCATEHPNKCRSRI